MSTILAVAIVPLVVAWLRTFRKVRSTPSGPERERLANTLWPLGGAVSGGAAIGAGLPPVSLPLTAQVLGIGCAVVFFVVGGVRARRFTARRELQLLEGAASTSDVVERIEMLDHLKALYPVPPLRARLSLIASLSMLIALSAWGTVSNAPSVLRLLFFSLGASSAALLASDLVKTRRVGQKRAWIESEISRCLGSGMPDASVE